MPCGMRSTQPPSASIASCPLDTVVLLDIGRCRAVVVHGVPGMIVLKKSTVDIRNPFVLLYSTACGCKSCGMLLKAVSVWTPLDCCFIFYFNETHDNRRLNKHKTKKETHKKGIVEKTNKHTRTLTGHLFWGSNFKFLGEINISRFYLVLYMIQYPPKKSFRKIQKHPKRKMKRKQHHIYMAIFSP